MPRLNAPSHPPMIQLALRKRPGPIVFAKAGDKRRAALEAGNRVLFDSKRVELRAQPVRLRLPLGLTAELSRKMRFPKGDVEHPTDPKDDRQLSPLAEEGFSAFRITG